MGQHINLKLFEKKQFYYISYTDNGIGFDFEEEKILTQSERQGLVNLIYRIKTLSGKIYFTQLEKGINILCEIPVHETTNN